MRCDAFDAQLVELVLGLLSEAEAMQMQAHAEGCATCAARLAEERSVEADLRDALQPKVPAGLSEMIKGALATQIAAETKTAPAKAARWYRPAYLLAAAALLALGLWALRSPNTGRAIAISGQTQIITDGAELLSSHSLAAGQRVVTGTQSSALLSFGDAQIWLGANTEVRLGDPLSEAPLTLRRGRALVIFGSDFTRVIHTPLADVRARGATFELNLSEVSEMNGSKFALGAGALGAVALFVVMQSGEAQVRNTEGQITVSAGERATVSGQHAPQQTHAQGPTVAELEGQVRDLREARDTAQAEIRRLKAQVALLETAKAEEAVVLRPVDAVLTDLRALIKSEGMKIYGLSKDHPLFKELLAMGPEGIKLLGGLLKTGDQGERFAAAALMEKLMNPEAIGLLEAAIFDGDNDSNVLVQRMASHALGKIGGEAAVPVLERVLREGSEWGVRTNAAHSLAEMGRKSGIDWLLESYNTQDDAAAKMTLLASMSRIGDPSYLPTLHTVLQEETEYSKRYLAVVGIAKAARQESLPVLEAIINNPEEDKMIIAEAQKAYDEIKEE